MSYSLLSILCESRLIPSRDSLKKWDEKQLRELAYLYFLALRILIADDKTNTWAVSYADKTLPGGDFEHWRTDGNDFYVLLYALSNDEEFKNNKSAISASAVHDWLRHSRSDDFDIRTHRLFNRLDGMFHITESEYKSIRRVVDHWTDTKAAERQAVLTKVIHHIRKLAPSNSEVLGQLEKIPKQTDEKIDECASSGGTSAASVATVVGGIGAGFAPDEKWRGIYEPAKKKVKSPVIRRDPITSK